MDMNNTSLLVERRCAITFQSNRTLNSHLAKKGADTRLGLMGTFDQSKHLTTTQNTIIHLEHILVTIFEC